MSSSCEHNDLLLMRNGTSQNQRCIDALDPGNIKLHNLDTEDWMRFALKFSEKVNYFDTKTNTLSGDWGDFFIKESEIKDFVVKLTGLEETENDSKVLESNIQPHLTLFAAFLKLTSFSQERLNGLSKKHLDFYYKEVLKLDNKAPVADKVHLLFELAKNASEVRIEENTALDGGKDGNGAKRIYKTKDEIIVNKASVASLRNVFHEENVGVKNAFVANSFDGMGEDFPDDEIRWWPFGYPTNTPGATQDTGSYPDLPFAKTGFGLSSPVLLLKEGKRTITFTFDLSLFKLGSLTENDLSDILEVSFSGEKEWVLGTIITKKNKPINFLDDPSSIQGKILKIVVLVDEGSDPIIHYNQEVLLEPYATINPIARFIIDNNEDSNKGDLFQQLFSKATVNSITIDVSVAAIQDIVVENDLGVLDASKPFLPFGPQPVVGSNFFIGIPEILDKNWSSITVDLSWKDKPKDFRDRYYAYREEFLTNLTKSIYNLKAPEPSPTDNLTNLTKSIFDLKTSGSSPTDKFKVNKVTQESEDKLIRIVTGEDYFKVDIDVLQNGVWEEIKEYELFKDWLIQNFEKKESVKKISLNPDKFVSAKSKAFSSLIGQSAILPTGQSFIGTEKKSQEKPEKAPEKFSAASKKGFVRVTLNQSFLHSLFPRIFSVAMSKPEEEDTIVIPNEPYTPQVETISISYKATASTIDKEISLFHEHPFGISEENTALKKDSVLKDSDRGIKLLPTYKKGSLFIALENAENLQTVSLLVQTLEGSENPETTNDFEEGEKLQWSILCANEWLTLNTDYIITNNTDNFLKSGIVKLSIPKQATKDNTKLPTGYFWLKVDNPRDFDTVSQLMDIKAQAVLAQFEDNNNELSHLQYGIPAGTISKLVERLANVKGAVQNFGSSDGKLQETDKEFYQRVSERSRHKQRATTQWDYEHLILQEFPDIYKVNCLNHTSSNSFLSPGNVTLIVIPNTINQNVYDPYKPRVSKAKRNEIQSFINQLNTLHVTAEVINPIYEEVQVTLKAKFYEGKDENFYSTQLQKDIAQLLAPWAFEKTSVINFGITLHESVVIDYIEKLEYVDYIKDFQLKKETGTTNNGVKIFSTVKKVVPSSAKVILTSVKYTKHKVDAVTPEEGCTVLTSAS
ncbi:baseplate J-like protein [Aquimarina sp. MAR_2010_214]|uniref:baseplate J/gp47 family protein n=1 Tax=Aquimarina sp. MAR_2010_214 TaxID=1250026 RepID=UPI000C700120|nr:baseplate J/gp47 family protein [Aquimarina sp. MAR_2010_214]PKV49118.1 baseplate J-like protein [Aquimarina sp. MAR_2010_214]